MGLDFGIWMEPEMVSEKSALFKEHPDWIPRDAEGNPVYAGSNWSTFFPLDQEASEIWISVVGENHPDLATNYNNISVVYISTGQYDKALEYCQLALKIRESNFGENDSRLASSYNNIGSLYYRLGQYDN